MLLCDILDHYHLVYSPWIRIHRKCEVRRHQQLEQSQQPELSKPKLDPY